MKAAKRAAATPRRARASGKTHDEVRERAARSERQLSTAQQITHMGSWEWDSRNNQVTWSDELYRIYGLVPRSCKITFEGFLARVHPEDRERIRLAVSQAVESKSPFRYRERIVRDDGTIRLLDTAGEASFDERGRFAGLFGVCRDISEEYARTRLEQGMHRVLEMIASATPLPATLTELIGVIERESDGMLGSILLLEDGERLRVVAAPNLPDAYNRLLVGFPVGPQAGSCGTAVHRRRPVIVTDTLEDRLWKDYRVMVADYGLRACWSMPIFANDERVLGTFALYYREPRSPTEEQLELIQHATYIAGIAIERSQMEEQLRALSAHIESAREDERAGIAREIHDELGQALTGLKMDLVWLGRRLQERGPELAERIAAMSKLIDETIGQVRRISAELRPGVLDDLGLSAALEWQAQEFEKRTGTRCAFHSNVADVKFTRDVSTAVFRIGQEALTNVARHARATRVDIRLERIGQRLWLLVADDGAGMQSSPKKRESLGLLGIRERARRLGAEVEVTAGKGSGTIVSLIVPLEGERLESHP